MWASIKDVGEILGAVVLIAGGAWWLSGRFTTLELKIDDIQNNHLSDLRNEILYLRDRFDSWVNGNKK